MKINEREKDQVIGFSWRENFGSFLLSVAIQRLQEKISGGMEKEKLVEVMQFMG